MDVRDSLTSSSVFADCGKQKAVHKFSPEALPFTPRNSSVVPLSPPQPTEQASSPALSPFAVEFYPKDYASYGKNRIGELDVVLKVRQAVSELTVNPADFDQYVTTLAEHLSTAVRSESTLAAVMEEIFVQSLREANFRYSGARMCGCLLKHLQLESGANFQSYLVNRCLAEFDYQCQFAEENLSAIVDLVLFISELMMNMKDAQSGQVISHFPQQIAQLIFLLLSTHSQSELAMHCVVQVLKLTGAVLEDHVTCLDEMFTQIRELILDSRTPQNTRAMFVCLVELRACNWARNETDHTVGAGDSMTDTQLANDNQTPEEAFLSSFVTCESHDPPERTEPCWSALDEADFRNGATQSEDGPRTEYWAGDQAMDSETAAAFEEFIAESCSRPRPCPRSQTGPPKYEYRGNWQ